MNLATLLDALRSHPEYRHLLDDLRDGLIVQGMGLMRAARLPLAAALHRDLTTPLVWVVERTDRALALQDELSLWLGEGEHYLFPEPNPLFYEHAAWGMLTRKDRLQVLSLLSRYHLPGLPRPDSPPLIVAPLRAVMTRTLPRREFVKHTRLIRVGQTLPLENFLRQCLDIGYQRVEVVVEAGQIALRGGILDLWPPTEPLPLRLEFFGDELDTLRQFDPATQRTVHNLEQALITPAREVLPVKAAAAGLTPEEADEFWLPLVYPLPGSLLDYLPRGTLLIFDDLDLLRNTANEIEELAVRMRQDSIAEGLLAPDFPLPYLPWSELQDLLGDFLWLEMGHSQDEEGHPLARQFQPQPRFGGRLKSFLEWLALRSTAEEEVLIVSRQVSRLRELWDEHRRYLSAAAEQHVHFIEGSLSEGWMLARPEGKPLHLVGDSELFGWERPQPRRRARPQAAPPEAIYADLKPGDWVVHVDYGIGRFVGLVRRTLEGVEREFLCIAYAEGDQLFVPVHQADRISRYISPDGEEPTPTRLGTADWNTTKQRVREAVREVARELLELYAKRQVAQGFAFSPDTPWQQELEASFPYIETEDQLRAIEEVKRDMETPRPMDRLLCGDVGYGKTEVALRAAFKAVMDGKQVAVLVPTTILAQQHYETFRQRLAPFPVNVEMLSRFRKPKEQEDILIRLALGDIDIIIGTHRLLQPDVVFKDLGLVIIDEEQRFGVTHKEYFKKLRTEVDVLTLTATPIPRTLYMALAGVRDISVINTPPAERLPVITHIGPYSPRLVRQAILREMERGGQVFFVHNRVQTIQAMRRHLETLVPEARIAVAHGQMPEEELAKVMERFTRGEVDVLLCTSIIESGLDIPNANTLIVDRGDTFGLAQLYQLRGRVGRGTQRAYAYFFRHRKRPPTPEGQERLEIIAENTQLGSGYAIAMRDLEMRGAGEILGTRQHGYIASVGFHLYTRLLAQAVRELRREYPLAGGAEPTQPSADLGLMVNVDLPLDIGIPISYVPAQSTRLSLYRRLAEARSENELAALGDEFHDRFGPLPESVQNLFFQMQVKLRAEAAGLASVSVESGQLVLRYPPRPDDAPPRPLPSLEPLARTGKNAYWMSFDPDDPQWRERLLKVLERLSHLEQPQTEVSDR